MKSLALSVSRRFRWAPRAAAALFVGGTVIAFLPVSAEPPVQADSSLFSEDQATRGKVVYASHCAVCHGFELTGGGGSPTLKGPDFLFGWSRKSTKDLVDYISVNMPPGQGRSLSGQEYEDVAAYILGANGFRAGQSPLTATTLRVIDQPSGATNAVNVTDPAPTATPAKEVTTQHRVPEGQEQEGAVNADATYIRALEERHARLAGLSPVTDAMLANPADGDWLTWRRTYAGLGFSPLRQVNRENAGMLTTAWSWSLPVSPNAITPLAHDGVLFVYSANRVQALDGTNGDLLWQYIRALPSALGGGTGYSLRNIAIYDDKLFVPTADGHMVALETKTGKLVWDKKIVPEDAGGVRLTGGPTVVKGKVIQGTSLCFTYKGGCFITALDARTGEQVWRFNTIARPGEPGGDSWNGAPLSERYGGAIWTSGSYDSELNLYYIGVGQTYDTATLLQPQKAAGASADALYTNTTLALDPDTGKLKWHYQHFQRDVWDFDWAFERSLLTLNVNGRPRRVSLTAGKLGIFDAIDRTNGKYLLSHDVGLQTLVVAIDPKTGTKRIDPALAPKADESKSICPHAGGARSWPATAVDPVGKIAFVPLAESCMDFTWTPRDAARTAAGGTDIRWKLKVRPGSDGKFGRVQAINVETGKVLWVNRRRAPQSSSILATAGGLVFEGGRDRRFRALDNSTGKTLWEARLSAVPSSTPITYSAGGRQYIAVVAGGGNAHDSTWPILTPEIDNPVGATTLWIFALPESEP
ncbi:PQQ-binding-like beta-propeller repeat protein [Sphingorhabdus lacus]|uniref:C-type cytochrome n=1 Tax=Sphingorhabdus lacus TaxID=392610 RepID=A0A6I6L5L8_9SPHN|nr:PQQ-binding-like beta-propeller repeat protein [Sphingorhabdus lacus]QGY79246.1 c-type cytochrome [Sphingorhabdus lacus]